MLIGPIRLAQYTVVLRSVQCTVVLIIVQCTLVLRIAIYPVVISCEQCLVVLRIAQRIMHNGHMDCTMFSGPKNCTVITSIHDEHVRLTPLYCTSIIGTLILYCTIYCVQILESSNPQSIVLQQIVFLEINFASFPCF